MSPPPPRPDDETPPPASGWEVVEPARDPLLDDPLFAEIVEPKPLPELAVEPTAAQTDDDLPMAEALPVSRATPVDRPRPRPVAPPPPPRKPPEEPIEAPKPRVFAACAVLGCFGLGFLGAMGFMGWALLTLVSGLPDDRSNSPGAAARPGPVGPTQMVEPVGRITLPGRVHAVGRAAGGRYLLLHVQQTKQVLVFDPNTGKIREQRFDCGPKGMFAGSASKLFIFNPDAKGEELQRWNLETGIREKSAPRPGGILAPSAMVTGAGVDGPVYFVLTPTNAGGSIQSIDGDTLALQESIAASTWQGAANMHVRASDDGSLWGATTQNGATLVRITQTPARGLATFLPLPRKGTMSPFLATPSPDGELAYTTVGVVETTPNPPKKLGVRSPYAFPTAHGSDLFLSVGAPVAGALTGPLRLHVATEPDLNVEIPDVDVPPGFRSTDTGTLPPDQRIHVWPAAGIAVVIPMTAGAVNQPDVQVMEVRRVDVPSILKTRDDPFLVIGSEPQLWAVRGREWRYQPTVWTKREVQTELMLKTAPEGMSVNGGTVVWTPSGDATQAEVRIRVECDNLHAEQRFRLTIVDDPSDD